MDDLTEIFGEVIYAYTRKQAIDDGVLVDVRDTAKEAGFTLPTAVTAKVWAEVVVPQEDDRKAWGQSEAGRLWDVLWMACLTARKYPSEQEVQFGVLVRQGDVVYRQILKMHVGPGDEGEPVITIMFPQED